MGSLHQFRPKTVEKKSPASSLAVSYGGIRYNLSWRMTSEGPAWCAWAGGLHGPEVADPGLVDALRRLALRSAAEGELPTDWPETARRMA